MLNIMIWLTWYLAFLCFLMMAWYPCCCKKGELGDDCQYCIDGDTCETVSIAISGAADADCDNCASMDGTYLATQSTTNACIWDWTSTDLGCSDADPTSYWNMSLRVLPATDSHIIYRLTIIAVNAHGGLTWNTSTKYIWDSDDTVDIDCLASHSLTYEANNPTGQGDACSLTGLTVSINPSC
jgi:hypothetical protein